MAVEPGVIKPHEHNIRAFSTVASQIPSNDLMSTDWLAPA